MDKASYKSSKSNALSLIAMDPMKQNALHIPLLSRIPSSVPTGRKLNIVKSNKTFPQGTNRILSQVNSSTANDFMYLVEMDDTLVFINQKRWKAACNVSIAIGDGDEPNAVVPKKTSVEAYFKLGKNSPRKVNCEVDSDGTCDLKRKVLHAWKLDTSFDKATFTITEIISKGLAIIPV